MAEATSNGDIENINPIESMAEAAPKKPETEAPLDLGVKEILGKVARSKLKAQMQSKEQTKLNQLRLSFKASLAKLTEGSTKEVGMHELQTLITENATSQALRVYLGLIAEGHKNINTNGKELYVLLLGYIAKAYKKELADPIDKPPTLIKAVTRMCEIVLKYLAESSSIVHHACALTLIKIFEHCTIDIENDVLYSIFYAPLEALVSGGNNKMAQMGATHCLYELFAYLQQKGNVEFLTYLLPKYLALFIKSTCEHADFIGGLGPLIETCGIRPFIETLSELFAKLNRILESPMITAHMAKIEAAKIHKLLAQRLHTAADVVVGYYWPAVAQALETAMRDRVLKVQNAANEARNEWEKLKEAYMDMEKKKTVEERPKTAVSIVNKYKEARRLAKQQKMVESPSKVSNKIEEISAIWGSAARAAKFLKKRDGSGGGNLVQGIIRKSRTKMEEPMDNEKVIRELSQEPQEEYKSVPKAKGMTAQEYVLLKKREFEQRRLQEEQKAKPEEDSLEEIKPESILEPPQKPQQESPGIDRQSDAPDIDLEESKGLSQPHEVEPGMEGLKRAHIHPPQRTIIPRKETEILRDTVDFSKMKVEPPVSDPMPSTTAQWLEAAKKLGTGMVEESYKTVLSTEDDLYLLRIMLQTGPVCKKLSSGTSEAVLRRTNQIVRANAIPTLLLKWIEQAVDNGDFYHFNKSVQNELLDTLYELGESKTELGENAGEVYRKVIISGKHAITGNNF